MAKQYSAIGEALQTIGDDVPFFASIPAESGRPKRLPGPLEGKLWDKPSLLSAIREKQIEADDLFLRPVINGKAQSTQIRVSLDFNQQSISVGSPGAINTQENVQSLPSGQVPAGSYVQDSVMETVSEAWKDDKQLIRELLDKNEALREDNLKLACENVRLQCENKALKEAPPPSGPPTLEQNLSTALVPLLMGVVQKKMDKLE